MHLTDGEKSDVFQQPLVTYYMCAAMSCGIDRCPSASLLNLYPGDLARSGQLRPPRVCFYYTPSPTTPWRSIKRRGNKPRKSHQPALLCSSALSHLSQTLHLPSPTHTTMFSRQFLAILGAVVLAVAVHGSPVVNDSPAKNGSPAKNDSPANNGSPTNNQSPAQTSGPSSPVRSLDVDFYIALGVQTLTDLPT